MYELLHDPRAFTARVRAELHQLVRCLSEGDYEGAATSVREDADDPWTAERFERAITPFLDEYGPPVFDHDARSANRTRIVKDEPRLWTVSQVLVDSEGDELWYAEGKVDLRHSEGFEGLLVRLHHLGP